MTGCMSMYNRRSAGYVSWTLDCLLGIQASCWAVVTYIEVLQMLSKSEGGSIMKHSFALSTKGM